MLSILFLFSVFAVLFLVIVYKLKNSKTTKQNNLTTEKSIIIEKEGLSNNNVMKNSNLKYDELDDNTKNYMEDKTLFIDDEGYVDEYRGKGKILIQKIRFFIDNVNGINHDDVVWVINETNLEEDIDGQWHFCHESVLMKCFSKDKFDLELDKLLNQNDISKDSVEYKTETITYDNTTYTFQTKFYRGSLFTIEIPPVESQIYSLIVIQENEIVDLNMSYDNSKEIDQKKQDLIVSIFDAANILQNNNKHQQAIKKYNKIIDRLEELKNKIKDNLIIETVILDSNDTNSTPVMKITPIDGVYFNLGQSYRACNEMAKAKEAFENAIDINPNTEAVAFHQLGFTKMQLGDFTSCIEDFTSALKKDKNSHDSYYMRAVAYACNMSELRDLNQAKKDVKKYLKIYPNDDAANKLLNAINGV
jgi:tetratricopeptide (TPR) repeat protein